LLCTAVAGAGCDAGGLVWSQAHSAIDAVAANTNVASWMRLRFTELMLAVATRCICVCGGSCLLPKLLRLGDHIVRQHRARRQLAGRLNRRWVGWICPSALRLLGHAFSGSSEIAGHRGSRGKRQRLLI